MGYAVKPDGSWRAVDNGMILAVDETFSEIIPGRNQAQAQAELLAQMTQIVEAWLDQVATERGYKGILSACSYGLSANSQWKLESLACIAWRDAVWETAITIMNECKAGTRSIPTAEELIAALPVIVWP